MSVDNSAASNNDAATVSGGETPAGSPAASETPASATGTQGESPADALKAPADAPGDDPAKFQKSSDYKRISRQRANAERRAMRAEAELAALRANAQQQPATPAKSAELRASDFANFDEYQRALIRQEAERIADEKVASFRKEQSQRETATAAERSFSAFEKEATKQAEAAGLDFEDDWQTISELPHVSRAVAEYLYEASDNKALLVHHFAENPDEVARISNLHPAQAFKELARLDSQLGTKPKPNATKAPPPVPTVGGRAVTQNDPGKMDMDDYASYWHARRAKKAS